MSSEERRTRRRFLADLLFAGGGLAGAAYLMRVMNSGGESPPTGSTPTPSSCATGDPVSDPVPMPGEMVVPEPELHPEGEMVVPEPEPRLDGDVAMPEPEPAMPGKMAVPSPEHIEPEGKVKLPQSP